MKLTGASELKKRIDYLDKMNNSLLIFVNVLLICIIGLIDFLTGVEFDFSIFYLVPISVTSWYANKRLGIFSAIVSEIIWFVADILGGHIYSTTLILLGNSIIRLCLFIAIALLLSNFKRVQRKQHQSDLLLQKNKNVIETFQKLTAIIAENITQQNAEIIMWVNKKKNKGENVSQRVEKASQIIGLSMKYLSETSYLNPYRDKSAVDSESYLELLKRRLSEIKLEISPNSESKFIKDD